MAELYKIRKLKLISRRNINNYRKDILKIKNCCEICGSYENIEIHHLDYTWDKPTKK